MKHCVVCGAELPKLKRKFCNDECRARGNALNIPKGKTAPAPRVSIDDILAFANEYKKEIGIYLGFSKAREEMKRRGYPV